MVGINCWCDMDFCGWVMCGEIWYVVVVILLFFMGFE